VDGQAILAKPLRDNFQDALSITPITKPDHGSHPIHAHGTILAGASVRFFEPVNVHQIGERDKSKL
jgi:hypothetical protein